jgi:hypothetical protein
MARARRGRIKIGEIVGGWVVGSCGWVISKKEEIQSSAGFNKILNPSLVRLLGSNKFDMNFHETGFRPAISIYQPHDTTSLLRPQHNLAQKKIREKEKRNKCRQRNKDAPPPLCYSENSHNALSTLKRRIPSNTFKEESENNDTDAWASPRVPPVHRGEWGRSRPERKVGVGRAGRDFSRSPKKHPLDDL